MRSKLKAREGKRMRFRGIFVRYGTKPGYAGGERPTLLLRDVIELESGQRVTDHLWFNLTKRFESIGPLEAGDIVEFDARVKPYRKGYRGHNWEKAMECPPSWDYKLSHPTRVSKVG